MEAPQIHHQVMEAPQIHHLNDDLRFQLQCVFDACDSDNSGTISLRDLADLSRGHVGSGDVEQVLQILGPGDDDKINFSQFCSRVMTIMNSGGAVDSGLDTSHGLDNSPLHGLDNSPLHGLDNSPLHGLDTSANSPLNRIMDNSPLKIKRSPRRTSAELNNSGSPAKRFGRKNSKKISQAQVVGRIPLVNTSSEEEDDLEDSFDRKIAASLETARPNRMIPDSRTIPDNTHKPRVNSLSNSPAKAGFQRTGMMRSTVRRSTSRLPSGGPAHSKPAVDDRRGLDDRRGVDDELAEESFSSPLTGCPPGETISPVLPRTNFSNSSSPLSSSPSEISSTVFNEETPDCTRIARKDSSRQTPVTVQGMARNRDTPLHISETEPPATSKVSIINTTARNNSTVINTTSRDNTTVIQVLSQDLEEDFSTIDSKAPSPEDYDSPSSGVGSSTGGWTSSGTGGWTSGVGSSNGEGTGGWSSGVGSTNGVSTVSIRADLEEEMSSSIQRVRKIAEEKAKAERMRHQEEMDGLQRERALERKNFQLRLEQFQTEKEQMKNEIMTLREKVKLLHMEKENTEEQLLQLAEQNEQVAVQEQEKQEEFPQKEEELLIQLNQLSTRVTSQDSELAEVREDNSILRSQNKKLKEAMYNINKDKDNRFRIFGAAKEPVPSWTDPSWDDPTDVRKRVRRLEEELADQREVNNQLKSYVGEVLVNIMVKNPQILEKN